MIKAIWEMWLGFLGPLPVSEIVDIQYEYHKKYSAACLQIERLEIKIDHYTANIERLQKRNLKLENAIKNIPRLIGYQGVRISYMPALLDATQSDRFGSKDSSEVGFIITNEFDNLIKALEDK